MAIPSRSARCIRAAALFVLLSALAGAGRVRALGKGRHRERRRERAEPRPRLRPAGRPGFCGTGEAGRHHATPRRRGPARGVAPGLDSRTRRCRRNARTRACDRVRAARDSRYTPPRSSALPPGGRTRYRAVVPDLRGHGRSSGDFLTYGALDAHDLSQLANALDEKGLLSGKLGVVGTSYGAATAIEFAGVESARRCGRRNRTVPIPS